MWGVMVYVQYDYIKSTGISHRDGDCARCPRLCCSRTRSPLDTPVSLTCDLAIVRIMHSQVPTMPSHVVSGIPP